MSGDERRSEKGTKPAGGDGASDLLDAVPGQIPIVDYLVLEPEPHLRAWQCRDCGARFFDRRVACGCCGGRDLAEAVVSTDGTLRSFTIVHRAAPGIEVPYVSAIVDCGGTTVRSNLVDVEPNPEHVRLGMAVRLTSYVVGTDSRGTDALAFGFVPADTPVPEARGGPNG